MLGSNTQTHQASSRLTRDELRTLRGSTLFAKMQSDHFGELMEQARLHALPPKIEIIRESDPADYLYVVTEGCVELFAGTIDRETTIALVRPVSSFILSAVLDNTSYLMGARTVHQSQVLVIPAEKIRSMLRVDPAFARSMTQELATGYRGAIESLKNHKLRTGTERLANYLLACSQKSGVNGSFRLDLHKRKLASVLGMTPENLSRAFATLKSHGVRVEGQTISIYDVALLRELAQPTPLIDDRQH